MRTGATAAQAHVLTALGDASRTAVIAFWLLLPLIGFETVTNINDQLILTTRFPLLAARRNSCCALAVRSTKILRSLEYRSRSKITFGRAASAPLRDRKSCAILSPQRIPPWRENFPAPGPSSWAKQT